MDLDKFDVINFDPENKYFSNKNKKVIRKMKDKCSEKDISEFIGLRPKLYAFQHKGEKTDKNVKE